jgi:hypothetical protein
MTSTKGTPAATSPAAGLPASCLGRARELYRLLTELAQARADETTAYATAYLEAEGSTERRTQVARQATAAAHLAAELAAAQVAAYRLMLDSDITPAGQARSGEIDTALWSLMIRHRVSCPDAAALMAELASVFDAYATGDSTRVAQMRREQLDR